MTMCTRYSFYLGIMLLTIFRADRVESQRSYKGHKIFRVVPRSNDDVTFLAKLLQTHTDVDVWRAPSRPGSEVHIHLGPDVIEYFKALLQDKYLVESTTMADSQDLIDNQITCCKSHSGVDDFDSCYHTLEEIHSELHRLEEAHPAIAKVLNFGNSHEGRPMLGIKITRGKSNTKGLVFLNFGIHAREWISPATGMYLIRQLLNFAAHDDKIENMLDKFEWVFLPVSNVDGFSFTHEKDRLWRKNRRVINSSLPSHPRCVGVDLNRNFDSDQWRKGSGVNHPCTDFFPGERPFSEVESSNIAAYLSKHKQKIAAFFDIHSYSKLWLSPWGWKNKKPPEYSSQMETLMKVGTDAIYNTTGQRYNYGPIFSTIYQTYGDLTDYVYDKLNVTHSYGLELRPGDKDPEGFLLSSCEIVPTGKEIMAAPLAITPLLEKEKNAAVKVEGDEKQNKRINSNMKEDARREEAKRVKTGKSESEQKRVDKEILMAKLDETRQSKWNKKRKRDNTGGETTKRLYSIKQIEMRR